VDTPTGEKIYKKKTEGKENFGAHKRKKDLPRSPLKKIGELGDCQDFQVDKPKNIGLK